MYLLGWGLNVGVMPNIRLRVGVGKGKVRPDGVYDGQMLLGIKGNRGCEDGVTGDVRIVIANGIKPSGIE